MRRDRDSALLPPKNEWWCSLSRRSCLALLPSVIATPIPPLLQRRKQHLAGRDPEAAARVPDSGYSLHILFANRSVPADDFRVTDHVEAFTKQICEVIVGKNQAVKLAVACLLARGHLLI